jgi:uncharacterized protein
MTNFAQNQSLRFFLIMILFFSVGLPMAGAVDRQVSVTGGCTRSVVPDRASIIVTSEVRELDPKKAMTKATDIYEKVREKVLKLKIENRELTTSEVSLNELKEWENNKTVSKGFVARMGIRVESSDAASLGDVSRVATESGMREIGSLTTFISSQKQRAETEICLKDAVKSAERKAREMVEAAGAKLGEVISLGESSSFQSIPQPMMARSSMMMADGASLKASPAIEAGKQEIQTQVSVVYGIK